MSEECCSAAGDMFHGGTAPRLRDAFQTLFRPLQEAPLRSIRCSGEKKWAFKRGGRPVIYGPEDEKQLLPQAMQWRHVTYTPDYDFMWMREWRIPTAKLSLDPEETLVVVPNDDAAFGIAFEMGAEQEYAGPDEYITEYWQWRDWYSFALDQLEKAAAGSDQVIAKVLKSQELRRGDPEERE